MTGYPLAKLLAIRSWREEAAQRELEARREAVRQAETILGETRRERDDYAARRPAEERALFARIRNRPVPLAEVDDFKLRILALRARESELDEAVVRAEKSLAAAEEALEEARARAFRAARERLKITEHGRLWGLAENQRLERLDEAELEDFPNRSEKETDAAPDQAEAPLGDDV
jgi:flagellar biosynthesis chaperone FliJ